jgi:hypothetical protein
VAVTHSSDAEYRWQSRAGQRPTAGTDRLAITLPARVLLGSPTIAELATAIAELANLQEVVSRPGPLRPPRG